MDLSQGARPARPVGRQQGRRGPHQRTAIEQQHRLDSTACRCSLPRLAGRAAPRRRGRGRRGGSPRGRSRSRRPACARAGRRSRDPRRPAPPRSSSARSPAGITSCGQKPRSVTTSPGSVASQAAASAASASRSRSANSCSAVARPAISSGPTLNPRPSPWCGGSAPSRARHASRVHVHVERLQPHRRAIASRVGKDAGALRAADRLAAGEADGVGAGGREAAQVLARRQLGRGVDQHRHAVGVGDLADALQRQAEVVGARQVRDGDRALAERRLELPLERRPTPSLAG